jgi:hypothetical protein
MDKIEKSQAKEESFQIKLKLFDILRIYSFVLNESRDKYYLT